MSTPYPLWMRLAALAIWLLAGAPGIYWLVTGTSESGPAWLLGYAIFGIALLMLLRAPPQARPLEATAARGWVAVLVASLGATIVMGGCHSTGLLLAVSAWQLATWFPLIVTLGGIAAQTALAVAYFCPGFQFDQGVFTASALLGAQLLGAFAVTLARREQASRQALEQIHTRLLAAQAELAGQTQLAERSRISGELHDVVGHSLTALSIQLEVASHLADGEALDHVRKSQALARSLLWQVRSVVSQLRPDISAPFGEALQQLVERVPALAIQCDVDAAARELAEPQRSVILRCVQELITNTLRHARARTLTISVRRSRSGMVLKADDDGAGTPAVRPGHGLRFLEERIGALGGSVAIESAAGAGFHVRAEIPC